MFRDAHTDARTDEHRQNHHASGHITLGRGIKNKEILSNLNLLVLKACFHYSCAAIVNDSERYVAMSHYVALSFTIAAQRNRSGNAALVPAVPCGTLVGDTSPLGTIPGSHSSSHPSSPDILLECLAMSSGLPTFLLSSSSIHSKTRLATLVDGSRRVCPIKHLLVAVVSCNAVCPDHAIIYILHR